MVGGAFDHHSIDLIIGQAALSNLTDSRWIPVGNPTLPNGCLTFTLIPNGLDTFGWFMLCFKNLILNSYQERYSCKSH